MNVGELAEKLGLEVDEYLELLELFIETGTSDIDKLHHALNEGISEKTVSAAHSLKGAAANLRLTDFSETAKEIEQRARNGQLEGLSDAVDGLKEKLDAIAASIKK